MERGSQDHAAQSTSQIRELLRRFGVPLCVEGGLLVAMRSYVDMRDEVDLRALELVPMRVVGAVVPTQVERPTASLVGEDHREVVRVKSVATDVQRESGSVLALEPLACAPVRLPSSFMLRRSAGSSTTGFRSASRLAI